MKNFEDLPSEEWKDITGYEGLYMISNLGRIRSFITRKYLKPSINTNGYYRVGLSKDNKSKHFRVHRLVAKHFIGEQETSERKFINHIDSDRSNNTLINLEWVTSMENQCHGYKNKKTSSQYSGVSHWNGYWRARITVDGKPIDLSTYKTEEEAYMARKKYEEENGIDNRYL